MWKESDMGNKAALVSLAGLSAGKENQDKPLHQRTRALVRVILGSK